MAFYIQELYNGCSRSLSDVRSLVSSDDIAHSFGSLGLSAPYSRPASTDPSMSYRRARSVDNNLGVEGLKSAMQQAHVEADELEERFLRRTQVDDVLEKSEEDEKVEAGESKGKGKANETEQVSNQPPETAETGNEKTETRAGEHYYRPHITCKDCKAAHAARAESEKEAKDLRLELGRANRRIEDERKASYLISDQARKYLEMVAFQHGEFKRYEEKLKALRIEIAGLKEDNEVLLMKTIKTLCIPKENGKFPEEERVANVKRDSEQRGAH